MLDALGFLNTQVGMMSNTLKAELDRISPIILCIYFCMFQFQCKTIIQGQVKLITTNKKDNYDIKKTLNKDQLLKIIKGILTTKRLKTKLNLRHLTFPSGAKVCLLFLYQHIVNN